MTFGVTHKSCDEKFAPLFALSPMMNKKLSIKSPHTLAFSSNTRSEHYSSKVTYYITILYHRHPLASQHHRKVRNNVGIDNMVRGINDAELLRKTEPLSLVTPYLFGLNS